MKEALQSNLSKYVQLSEKEFEDFFALTSYKTIPKNGYLLKADQICQYRFFIIKGLVRTYYIDDKGNERITQFAIENWWVTDLISFLKNTPSTNYIQAIEETSCLLLHKSNLEKAYRSNPKIERLFRMLTENHLMALQNKYTYYWHLSNKQKYEQFVKSLPDFAQRIPQYMIASYLEMTPEYLSDLRRK